MELGDGEVEVLDGCVALVGVVAEEQSHACLRDEAPIRLTSPLQPCLVSQASTSLFLDMHVPPSFVVGDLAVKDRGHGAHTENSRVLRHEGLAALEDLPDTFEVYAA